MSRRTIRYKTNPLNSYTVFRKGQLQRDEITGRPTYSRYTALDDFGNLCDTRDKGSFDRDPKRS